MGTVFQQRDLLKTISGNCLTSQLAKLVLRVESKKKKKKTKEKLRSEISIGGLENVEIFL